LEFPESPWSKTHFSEDRFKVFIRLFCWDWTAN